MLLAVTAFVLLPAGCSSPAGTDERAAATAGAGVLQLRDAADDAAPAGDPDVAGAPVPPAEEPAPLAVADLRPPAEPPVATGTPEASGWAVVTAMPKRSELCVQISVAGLAQPTAAHLQEAPVGGSGEVVLALQAPSSGDGSVDTCVTASDRLLERLRRQPGRFAISVNTAAAPDGALRGQLR